MLRAIDHIDLQVPDLDAFTRFMKTLGFVEIRRTNPTRRQIELALPGGDQVVFEVEQRAVAAPVIDHIALRVDDVQRAVEALRARDVEIRGDARQASSGRVISSFKDAAGMKWQLTSELEHDESLTRSWKLDSES